jgi:hypothetical protein
LHLKSFAAPRDIFRPAIDVPEGLAHTGFFIRTSGVIKDARDTFEVVDAGVNQQVVRPEAHTRAHSAWAGCWRIVGLWSGLVIEHAITRSVRDSAALLDATSGAAIGGPYWAPPPKRSYQNEVGADPGRLRIAFTTKA